jgi:hypothetical protein
MLPDLFGLMETTSKVDAAGNFVAAVSVTTVCACSAGANENKQTNRIDAISVLGTLRLLILRFFLSLDSDKTAASSKGLKINQFSEG